MNDETLLIPLILEAMVVMNLVGVRVFLHKTGAQSFLDAQIKRGVVVIIVFIATRALGRSFPEQTWLTSIMLLARAYFPLGFLLLTEGILKRHAPRWAKLSILGLSVFLLAEAGFHVVSGVHFGISFRMAMLVTIGICMGLLGTRLSTLASRPQKKAVRGLLLAFPLLAFSTAVSFAPLEMPSPALQVSPLATLFFSLVILNAFLDGGRVHHDLKKLLVCWGPLAGVVLLAPFALGVPVTQSWPLLACVLGTLLFSANAFLLLQTKPQRLTLAAFQERCDFGGEIRLNANDRVGGVTLSQAAAAWGPVFSRRSLVRSHPESAAERMFRDALLHTLDDQSATHGMFLRESLILFHLNDSAGAEGAEENLLVYWALRRSDDREERA